MSAGFDPLAAGARAERRGGAKPDEPDVRLGLERTERLLAAVGHPERRFRVLHIGGTNGKGSTAAMLASVLSAAGSRTGLYTSPPLGGFRERVRVDGRPLADGVLERAAERVRPIAQRERATAFEATTAVAFLALAEADADVAAVEVGLGGRLDATNVVAPEVVAITNVARDHTEYLGEELEAIAREKAGIIKAGVPVVTAETGADALRVLRRRARAVGAPLHTLGPDEPTAVDVARHGTRFRLRSEPWGELTLETPLAGRHQARNAALAVRALERLPAALRPDRRALVEGLRRFHWPGRLQIERVGGRMWVFDAAHNPAATRALVSTLPALSLPRPLVVLAGILADKEWRRMLPPLAGAADGMVLTVPPGAPADRRWDPTAALAAAGEPAKAHPEFGAALERAEERARPDGTVLVTGSHYTVAAALAATDRLQQSAASA